MAQQTAVEWLLGTLEQNDIIDLDSVDSDIYYATINEAKEIEKQNKIDFLVWLKENHWHVYKDGKWFTSKDHAYMDGKPRKFYTEEQVIEKYENK